MCAHPNPRRANPLHARAIDGSSEATIERHIGNCAKADPSYGEGVREAVEAHRAGRLSWNGNRQDGHRLNGHRWDVRRVS